MENTFLLKIEGDILNPGDQQLLINAIRPRIEHFSPDHEINVYGFLRSSYRIEVEGTPENFDYVDNMLSSVKLYIRRYLRNWKFVLNVSILERL